jgi:hypothetical protein
MLTIKTKRMRTALGVSLVAAVAFASVATAQERKAGLNGAAFLKIGVGARMVALGSAATTVHSDPNAMFWNPAGTVMDGGKTAVTFTRNEWLVGMNHDVAAVARSFNGIGTIGIGVIRLGLDGIAADRDIAPTDEVRFLQVDENIGADTYGFNDLAVMVNYSRQFTDRLKIGANFKFIRQRIDDQSATTVASDVGVIYETGFRDLTLGARLNNLGGDLEFYNNPAPIPLSFSLGASMSIAREENSRFTALVDAFKPQDEPQFYFAGAEWALADRVFLRGGYKLGFSGTRDSFGKSNTDEGFSFGGGIVVPFGDAVLNLDYAYTEFSILDNTHRFSFVFTF